MARVRAVTSVVSNIPSSSFFEAAAAGGAPRGAEALATASEVGALFRSINSWSAASNCAVSSAGDAGAGCAAGVFAPIAAERRAMTASTCARSSGSVAT